MRVDLLQKQIKDLRDDAANPNGVQFNLASWCEPADADKLDPALLRAGVPSDWSLTAKGHIPVSCGTQACAFGLSALLGTFADEGLTYHIDYSGNMIPHYKHPHEPYIYEGFTAASELFDITRGDAEYLFDPSCYDGAQEHAEGELNVADRIERFIKGDIDRDMHPAYKGDDTYDDDDDDDA